MVVALAVNAFFSNINSRYGIKKVMWFFQSKEGQLCDLAKSDVILPKIM